MPWYKRRLGNLGRLASLLILAVLLLGLVWDGGTSIVVRVALLAVAAVLFFVGLSRAKRAEAEAPTTDSN